MVGDGEEQVDVPEKLAEAAKRIAYEIDADAILAVTDTGKNCEHFIGQELVSPSGKEIKVIVATSNRQTHEKFNGCSHITPLKVTMWPRGRVGQASHAIACGLRGGYLSKGENLVCLVGDGFADLTDSLMVLNVTGEEPAAEMLESNQVLAAVVELCFELSSGGLERRPIGAAFVIGGAKEILRLSYQLMINPFENYRANVTDQGQWELLKKYANFDGAFVVDMDGAIVAAHRYLDANRRVEIPRGLGTRHLAVAAMTAATNAKGITVSGEDGLVRIFERGKMVAKINPNSKIIECLREPSKSEQF